MFLLHAATNTSKRIASPGFAGARSTARAVRRVIDFHIRMMRVVYSYGFLRSQARVFDFVQLAHVFDRGVALFGESFDGLLLFGRITCVIAQDGHDPSGFSGKTHSSRAEC